MNTRSLKTLLTWGLSTLLACTALFVPVSGKTAYASDAYDDLRAKYVERLLGGSAYDTSDANIADRISAITSNATTAQTTMIRTPTRNRLWNDSALGNDSAGITNTYRHIKDMAIAYRTYGSSLYGDSTLRTDIIDSLEFMNDGRFCDGCPRYQNWWHWEIGGPMALNDVVALMYDELTTTQIADYMAAIHYMQPSVAMTGANRLWEVTVIALEGINAKNPDRLAAARDGISAVFPYVTQSDGFYEDGSFIQHHYLAYTGGYGASMIASLVDMLYLLDGSDWEVTDAAISNVFQWIYDSYEPLIYNGNMMDMVRGREISRHKTQDNDQGAQVMATILLLSELAPPADASAFKSMVKAWLQADPSGHYFTKASIRQILDAQELLADSGIAPRPELVKYQQFANMDRVVQLRPGYGFGISMHSDRTMNYESINSENREAHFTGDGMTYLYNADNSQFNDNFWPTIDPYRLPGTTAMRGVTQLGNQKGTKSWAGGTDMLGLYGVTGMEHETKPDKDQVDRHLSAKKSWFMFDDEIVALGSDITSTEAAVTETIIENRKLNPAGDNALTVNGTAKSDSLGWSETMAGTNYAHLEGNAAGSDIGYYFPGGATVNALRESRTDEWKTINSNTGYSTVDYTHRFMTLWFDHGVSPANAAYSYVLLPNKSSAQVGSYAAEPDITILENSSQAHAVKENGLNVTGINFWNDGKKTVGIVTSDSKAAVMTRETADEFEISVSDPTHDNVSTIYIDVDKNATNLISKDEEITVLQYSPTIKFKVNVNKSAGKAFKVTFGLTGAQEANPAPLPVPNPYEAELLPIYSLTDSVVVYNDANASGGKKLGINNNAVGDNLTFSLDVPKPGHYNVKARVMKTTNSGIYQLSINGVNVGSPWDAYWSTSEPYKDFWIGSYDFDDAGSYKLTFTATGKIAAATGYRLWMDEITLAPVALDGEIVVDNTDFGFYTDSAWTTKTTTAGYYGPNFRDDGTSGADAGKWAKWVPVIQQSGLYDVYMRWTSATNRPDAAPIEIVYDGGNDSSITVDQRANGGKWVYLGTYPLAAGTANEVILRASDAGYTIADAVRFVPSPAGGIDRASGGTVAASGDNPPNETLDKAFDNTSAKWLAKSNAAWIQYRFAGDNGYAIQKYTITSAFDYSTRDPKDWTVYGSHDGVNWVALDTRTGETFATRHLKREFTIGNPSVAYVYYKLDITANNGHPYTQLEEIEWID
jgi:hyaluronate lyase